MKKTIKTCYMFPRFLNKMQKLIHLSKIRVIVLWVLCALFMVTSTATASELSGKTHFEYPSSLWTFSFNVVAKVDSSGTVQLYIKDVKKAHDQAWASMNIQAKITKIEHGFGSTFIDVKVTFQGMDNHFEESLETGKVTWGPPSGHVAHKTWTESIAIPIQEHHLPATLEPGPPAEYSHTQPSQPEQPESNDPCDLANRISKSVPASRIEFNDRTFLKFKKGVVRIKPVGCDRWVRAENNTDLKLGDIIKTGPNGRANIVISGTSFVKVKPGSAMIIPRGNPPEKVSFLKLIYGVIWAHAKKEKNSLKVATPHCVVGVRGTEFEVSYSNGKSCVKALKHTVWFSDIEKKHVVVVPEGMMSCMTDQEIKPSPPVTITGNTDENISMFDIAGRWKTNFGQMLLKQHSENISGVYTHDNGKLEGILKGRVLAGKWSEAPTYKPDHDAGAFKLIFSSDGNSFTGYWRYGFKGNSWDGKWDGTFIDDW